MWRVCAIHLVYPSLSACETEALSLAYMLLYIYHTVATIKC